MIHGAEQGPVIFRITQGASAKKIKVRLGFRPALVLTYEVKIADGTTLPGIIIDYFPGSVGHKNSSRLDPTAANSNEYKAYGANNAFGFLITDYGLKSVSAIGAAKTIIFCCFRPQGKFAAFSGASLPSKPRNKDFDGGGKLFSRGASEEESGKNIDVWKIA